MWSVLAALHPIPPRCNPERVHHYQLHIKELMFDDIEFPVPISKIPKFKKPNAIGINVFGFEQGALFPVYISKERFPFHVNLLLYSLGEKWHYCLIRNLNRFLSSQSRQKKPNVLLPLLSTPRVYSRGAS